MCMDCKLKLNKDNCLEKATNTTEAKDFKGWKGEDLATAFFETFGRYIKEPNKKDIETIMRIWLWAVHDNHTLSKTISYTFKWANMNLRTEYDKWQSK